MNIKFNKSKYLSNRNVVFGNKGMVDFNLNPQETLDKYRWQWIKDKKILVEEDFPKYIVDHLSDKGHEIEYSKDVGSFGRGQIILRDKGVYIGGTEKRADGHISVW